MANICATEDGYQRKTQMHGFMVLICGAFVYMCILIMVLFNNSSTEQPLKESQIVDFKPDISPTMYLCIVAFQNGTPVFGLKLRVREPTAAYFS